MTTNVAASIHRRLLNRSRAEDRPFNEMMEYFVLERFLYRLGKSSYVEHFILKGALLFSVWQAPLVRPTRNVDLLGRLHNDAELVIDAMRQICKTPVEEDSLNYHADAIAAEVIAVEAESPGVRLHIPDASSNRLTRHISGMPNPAAPTGDAAKSTPARASSSSPMAARRTRSRPVAIAAASRCTPLG